MKVLLVEDETRLAAAVCELLRMEGYEVRHIAEGCAAMAELEAAEYDAVILDIMLPGMSGLEIIRKARRSGVKIPVLMLTAKAELDDKVAGLDSGADDYLTKPFMTKELLARLRALTRRGVHQQNEALIFGDILLDSGTQTLRCNTNQQSVRLGEKEYRLLEYLMSNQRQILTREQLAVRIWGYNSEAEYNNVEVYLSFTRKKLVFVGSKVEIKSVRGVGYELRCGDV